MLDVGRRVQAWLQGAERGVCQDVSGPRQIPRHPRRQTDAASVLHNSGSVLVRCANPFPCGNRQGRPIISCPQDEKELIRNLSSAIGGNEVVMVAEEYLNPGTLSTPVDTPLPSTPTQKFFSSGPSSLPAPPTNFTSSPASQPNHPHNQQQTQQGTTAGLNGALSSTNNGQPASHRSHPRSSDGESDHEYYNDVDRLKRELQPLHQPRNETTV